ncbi:hypothetical protein [Microbacterium sp. P03]|uniref:glycoside hydrolase family 38 N-terminal domain-containing protein n=1 Tax=Microbacterium sp. P03 TaxID=3366946 RepID=UPI0037463620
MTIRQILLVPHTHHDVGYTNSPRIIDDMHARIVDRVLDLAGPATGRDDEFRWTFEVARPVLNFLRRAAPDRRAALRDLAAAGRVSVTGGYLNMTQLSSAAETAAGYEELSAMRDAGLVPRTQQHGDVNGLSWGIVDQMLDAGIDRLVMALNPDHGRPPFVQPSGFHWVAPTGRRIFVWLSTHYGFGEEWGIIDGDVALADRCISEFVSALEGRSDYGWQTAVVHAANDNRWPTDRFLDVVRAWNVRHPDLPMRTATIDEAVDVLEREAQGFEIPLVRGEWADWWSHGHGSTAREVAVYREAGTFARSAQSSLALAGLRGERATPLAEVLGYRRGPVRLRTADEIHEAMTHVDEQLLLYGEHTWGSWETYSKPHSTFTHSHHNAKSAFAYDAWDHARDLAIEGWYRSVHAGAPASSDRDVARVVVANHSESDRVEVVDVEVDGARHVRLAAAVPAFATASFDVPAVPQEDEAGNGIVKTDLYRLIVDPSRGGVISMVDRGTGRELIDPDGLSGLGAVVAEVVAEGSDHPMLTTSPKLFHPEHPGPLFEAVVADGSGPVRVTRGGRLTRISWGSALPGILQAETVVTISDDVPDVDVDVEVRKPEHFGPESIFVAFPFDVEEPEFLLETAGAVFQAESEQLPDTSKDWYSIQQAIGVRGNGQGILWGTRDAPLVQLGGFHTGQWARTLDTERGHVMSWLMNNLHFTNFPARQDIARTFRYRFRPAAVTRADVRRYGRDLREPLQARHYRGPAPLQALAPLRVEPAAQILVELRPLAEERVRLRLHNIADEGVDARVDVFPDGWEADAASPVHVPARGTIDLLLTRSSH